MKAELVNRLVEYARSVGERGVLGKIDHTLLKPYATPSDVIRVCREALEHGFCGCCVSSCYLKLAARELWGSGVKLVTVAGFPLGSQAPEIKAREVEYAFVNEADEVDVVMNVGLFKSGKLEEVMAELEALVDIARGYSGVVKVIIETSLLTLDEIASAARLVADAGADYVKTNTGFGSRGVVPSDVITIKGAIGEKAKIKAAGGIRHAMDALLYLILGADRIGTSSGVMIASELRRLLGSV